MATAKSPVVLSVHLNRHLNGGCQAPIRRLRNGTWWKLVVARPGGVTGLWNTFRAEDIGTSEEAEALGVRVAENLIAQGARKLLAQVGS